MAGMRGLKHEDPLSLEMFLLDELSREVGFESDEDALLEELPSERNREAQRARPRVDRYYEEVVPAMSDDEFRQHFRMDRLTIDTIVDVLGEREGSNIGQGPVAQPRRKQLLLALLYLGSSLNLRKVAEQFETGISTAYMFIDEITEKLSELCPIFIRLPTGQQMLNTLRAFEDACGVKGVLGAISDCHIPLKRPHFRNPQWFRNRRGYHSIHLQSVADAEGRFTAVDVGWPGSMSEAEVLQKSRLSEQLASEEVRHTFLPSECFLAGGPALPLRTWLMTPYPEARLSDTDQRRRNYNRLVTAAADMNQRAVGVMRARFPRLAFVETKTVKKAVLLVTATCVLHNMCISLGDRWGQQVEEEQDPNVQLQEMPSAPTPSDASRRRNRLVAQLWDNWLLAGL